MYPKQLLPLTSERTMLQETALRLQGKDNLAEQSIVICNEAHRFLVAEQLLEIAAPAKIREDGGPISVKTGCARLLERASSNHAITSSTARLGRRAIESRSQSCPVAQACCTPRSASRGSAR